MAHYTIIIIRSPPQKNKKNLFYLLRPLYYGVSGLRVAIDLIDMPVPPDPDLASMCDAASPAIFDGTPCAQDSIKDSPSFIGCWRHHVLEF